MSKELRRHITNKKYLARGLNREIETGSLVICDGDGYSVTSADSIVEILDFYPVILEEPSRITVKVILHREDPGMFFSTNLHYGKEAQHERWTVERKDFRPITLSELKRAIDQWHFWNAPKSDKTKKLITAAIKEVYRS
jgi:hypothetical protein